METNKTNIYDCAIVGGGLAGLALSIQLAKQGFNVLLFEKNKYPFHKVCGEYISMESWNFLIQLGVDLNSLNVPKINKLNVSAHNGYTVSAPLKMGGFGISRYVLDNCLFDIAKRCGVTILENCKVTNVLESDDLCEIITTNGSYFAKLACGSFGKIHPHFIERKQQNDEQNYVAVKYHIQVPFDRNLIALHNFKDGYCGISMINETDSCLCYLTTSKQLQENGNDIKRLEENVLMRNPHLKKIFSEATFLYSKPLAISNISFKKKECYQNGLIMLGDAAGTIAPLCGNGMSMALRSSKILAKYISHHLKNEISKKELIDSYQYEWNHNFKTRIKVGYRLQKLFGKKATTIFSLHVLRLFPKLFQKVISLTHGNYIVNHQNHSEV